VLAPPSSKGLCVPANTATKRKLLPRRRMRNLERARTFTLFAEWKREFMFSITARESPVSFLVRPDPRIIMTCIAEMCRPEAEPDGHRAAELTLVFKEIVAMFGAGRNHSRIGTGATDEFRRVKLASNSTSCVASEIRLAALVAHEICKLIHGVAHWILIVSSAF